MTTGVITDMALIKAFFFDLDGTLVDTHESNFRAYTAAIQNITGKMPHDNLGELIKAGESSHEFLPKAVAGINNEQIEAVNKEKKRLYSDHLYHSKLNIFLTNFLEQMSTRYKTVLVTTAKKDNALAVLKHHGIENLFSEMIFGDEVSDMKPHPEAYLYALKKVELDADEVLVFEDSEKGIAAAMAAGLSVVHVKDFI